MAGRRPKPTHIKLIEGNPGKRALNEREPKPPRWKASAPPEHLSDKAKSAWESVVAILDNLGVLTTADAVALERLWGAYAKHSLKMATG